MKAIKIRPNDQRAFTRKGRLTPQYNLPYHARGRSTFYDSLPVNQRTLIKIFGYLHGYAGHGTRVMRQRWRPAEHRFQMRHMPVTSRSTSQFVNEYTAHRWM
jgi:hypothetical protein